MNNQKYVKQLLDSTNYSSLDSVTSFVQTYIEKLVYNIATYADDDFTVGTIEKAVNYSGDCELSQEITGIPNAYSCVDGDKDALKNFAEKYSHLGITEFDTLAKEAVLDFLNLHNGLFVVDLSKNNICELSLDVPKQNGHYNIDSSGYASIIVIPIIFKYGTLNFLLCEL